MGNIFFWNYWSRIERILFAGAAIIFVAGIIWMWVSWYNHPAPVFQFQTISEAELAEVPVDRFQKGIFEFAITGNKYTVTERLLGAPMSINVTAGYIFLLFFALFVSGMLAMITTISRFYYLMCMGIFIAMIVTLKLETLSLLGYTDKTPAIIVLMMYVPASVGIVYFFPHLRFILRIVIFLAITMIIAVGINFFAGVALPFAQLAANAFPAGVAAMAIFIVTVSHEILAAFINILTKGTRQSKTLNHFFIISLVYLLNLGLTYAERFGFITWNAITIDLFLLLTISGVLGIWGFRQRQKQFEGIIDTEPYGILGFLLMGGLAFGVLAFMLATANDGGLSATRDIIIFSHIGFAIAFIIYVISNFIAMLAKNMAVYKVLYSPNNMPFFTFRFAGLVISLAFLFYNTWQVPVNNTKGAIQNANADYFLAIGNNELAEFYYQEGRTYAYNNHHSSYALANFEGAAMDFWKEREMYKAAVSVRPTEMAFLNLAQTFQTENKSFEAILAIQEGLAKFPTSPALQNTLALLYAQTNVRDSARWYLERVRNSSLDAIASGNMAALETRGLIDRNDSTQEGRPGLRPATLELPADTVLTITQAVIISNTMGQLGHQLDSATINKVVKLARRPVNSGFTEPLLFASALSWYSIGEIGKAFRLLQEVTIVSNYKGKYNNILTLWSLEHNEPQRALEYADYAMQQRYVTAPVTNAVAITEEASAISFFPFVKVNAAAIAWDTLNLATDSAGTDALANRMKNILTIPIANTNQLTDEDKYAFTLYRLSIADSATFNRVVATIGDDEWRARALLDRSELLFRADETASAVKVYQQIRGLQTTKATYDKIRIHETVLLCRTGNTTAIEQQLRADIDFAGRNRIYRVYFEAMLAKFASDSIRATPLFDWLGTADPFFEEGVISAANYFTTHGSNGMKSYQILVNALQNHPTSIRIRKAYCIEAKRVGLTSYADDELATLKLLLPPARLKQYLEVYNAATMEE
jgi:hypothetical protein